MRTPAVARIVKLCDGVDDVNVWMAEDESNETGVGDDFTTRSRWGYLS